MSKWVRGNIVLTGTGKIKRELAKQRINAHAALETGLLEAGKFLLKESKKIVPVDTGALRKSGYVIKSRNETKQPTVEVGYGNPKSTALSRYGVHPQKYAVKQHENKLFFHKPPTQCKYLIEPALIHIKKLLDLTRKGFTVYIKKRKFK